MQQTAIRYNYVLRSGRPSAYTTLDGTVIDNIDKGAGKFKSLNYYRVNRIVYDLDYPEAWSLAHFDGVKEIWFSPRCDLKTIFRDFQQLLLYNWISSFKTYDYTLFVPDSVFPNGPDYRAEGKFLNLNHSPAEWFSLCKNPGTSGSAEKTASSGANAPEEAVSRRFCRMLRGCFPTPRRHRPALTPARLPPQAFGWVIGGVCVYPRTHLHLEMFQSLFQEPKYSFLIRCFGTPA